MPPTRTGGRRARSDLDQYSHGALIALPISTCTKVIGDTVDRLAPINLLLGGRGLK